MNSEWPIDMIPALTKAAQAAQDGADRAANNLPVPVLAEPTILRAEQDGLRKSGEARESTTEKSAGAERNSDSRGGQNLFPKESGHWYDPTTGDQIGTIIGKNGKGRAPHIGDARKLGLVPGVTTITKIPRSFGLEKHMKEQVAWSALTIPRLPNESDPEFIKRILHEGGEVGRLASDRGKELHGAIENLIKGEIVPAPWGPHVIAVRNALSQYGIEIMDGKAEKTFVSPLGYGGKLDWHNDKIIIDFKTKDRIEEKKKLAYDEHVYQLAAYAEGLWGENLPWKRRLINVFVGAQDGAVRIHEWSPEYAGKGWRAFECLLNFWKITHEA